jgi:hypothetical protein
MVDRVVDAAAVVVDGPAAAVIRWRPDAAPESDAAHPPTVTVKISNPATRRHGRAPRDRIVIKSPRGES